MARSVVFWMPAVQHVLRHMRRGDVIRRTDIKKAFYMRHPADVLRQIQRVVRMQSSRAVSRVLHAGIRPGLGERRSSECTAGRAGMLGTRHYALTTWNYANLIVR